MMSNQQINSFLKLSGSIDKIAVYKIHFELGVLLIKN